MTGIADPVHLVASHIKPWRFCENGAERMDGNNGLLLTPNADRLFDRGFMTFADDGLPAFASRLRENILQRLGLRGVAWPIGDPFSKEQRVYLAFHREHLFVDDYKSPAL